MSDVTDAPPAQALAARVHTEGGTARPAVSRRRTAIEVGLVALLAGVWFFWGTGTGDFIGTEGLRALIAKEMLARGEWLIPTIHQRVYLRKPPLQAWTIATVASAAGRLDEQVARWPSAALATIYVLTMYVAARWLIDPRAGPVGAVFAAGNWFVLDYGVRAEMDIGVLTFSALSHLLLLRAWMSHGAARWASLALACLAAVLGSLWKAPHVLVCLWLTMAVLLILERRARSTSAVRMLLHPVHVVLALLSIGVVGWWYVILGSEAGGGRVASFTAIEFVVRMIPRNLDALFAILNGPLEFAYVALPFGLFAAVLLLRAASAERQFLPPHVMRFFVAWIIANIGLLLIAPSKAPRYWFTCFPPLVLLATLVWQRWSAGQMTPPVARLTSMVVGGHVFFVLLLAAGLLAVAALASAGVVPMHAAPAAGIIALIVCGLILLVAGVLALQALRSARTALVGGSLVVALLALKPPHVLALIPEVSAANTYRNVAQHISAAAPGEQPIYVLSETEDSDRSGEVADLGWYTDRDIRWPRSERELIEALPPGGGYVLARRRAAQRLQETVPEAALIDRFDWPDGPLMLLHIVPSTATVDSTSDPTEGS